MTASSSSVHFTLTLNEAVCPRGGKVGVFGGKVGDVGDKVGVFGGKGGVVGGTVEVFASPTEGKVGCCATLAACLTLGYGKINRRKW